MRLLSVLLPLVLVGYVLNKLYSTWLPTNYVFDWQTINQLCNGVIAQTDFAAEDYSGELFLQNVRDALASHYGDHLINEYAREKWVFNNAGGAMGQMIILHASISEYVIIFGTAVGTEGHTGVHFADDYFTILSGVQRAALPYAVEPEVYTPGQTHHLRKGYAKQYSMESGSFALELAQGWIPAMLPFGFLDTFSSTLDVYTLYRTVELTARDMFKNLVVNRKF
ncbi:C-8 sterol isomerase ERG2 KNAG_0I02410 [Huiozyma naganishii CBS 8797]|uniref:C-8 sterol isomerase n=1 Tax=Huiozyma naganishii (strain ATCC MYA-139 / BCRC 22969 / CBS 8797 / KCTC 17520 / NBRC 10181 / NCYC 3082 / Yp74L-3) TaxID=1071383 RepID=J7S2H9_HUIN7|nr:hypothetical protein KNAG_0I02410 [Kazachstania naganishii CBS 8797]CCK72027.1 hypothetical protein KNAG_0I02410 [Kazachstania naganishii CBS 8797]